MPFELIIGLRYLKAKRKSTFISIITFISTAGVMLGVMALIIVLAVMTGFEEDLKELVERKARGETIAIHKREYPRTTEENLVEALKASLK